MGSETIYPEKNLLVQIEQQNIQKDQLLNLVSLIT
jgi:hypothetical protein